ncbi:MAG: hypothetical protein E7110_00280 [Bacteroidales bacterium]|nr:hypothetical protein [Bacteroidales bacterium]
MTKKKKSPKKLLSGRGLSEQEKLFLILYIVGGYTQVEAYSIAFNPKASGQSIPPLASHLLADYRIHDVAVLLARYTHYNGIIIPKKYEDKI